MIEVNLHPGASRRTSRRSLRLPFSLPKLGAGANLDRWAAFIAVAWIVGPGLVALLFLSTAHRRATLEAGIEEAVRDSTRYATIIQAQQRLIARRDTIAQKLQLIQKIDAGRYIWPHLLDEISRALPDYTWLTRVSHVAGAEAAPEFQIVGRAGNTFALTRFMNDLEASPFIRGVQFTTTQQVKDAGDRVVLEFILLATYEEPTPDLIETVPLFAAEER